ncbi:DUF4286 family protein [Saccharopolyspora phatthalungensis]|uniref:Uncharacterized protein n=1 Tax=Saccharopolyspora phatthalungensis TaxID=664693 RepID=A0A840QFS8_9PSEU|nr:DUF4286 family protein [Saccharopolyspora phatthalungensis]MBB5158931.1 hypothetical protein [Saccharopolyspora phatthalungensis]
MSKMIHAVFSDAVSQDREEEFNDWYSRVHVPDVCAIPGVVGARRFKLADVQSAFAGQVAHGQRYLVIYEIDTDDPEEVERQLRARFADGRLRPTDTMAADPPPIAVYYNEIS